VIGLSSFVLGSPMRNQLTERFEQVKAWGYDLIEVAFQDPSLVDAALVRRRAADAGLTVAVAGDFTGGREVSAADPALRAGGMDYLLASIDFAADAGATQVAGPMYGAVGKTKWLPPAERRAQLERAATALVTAAAHGAERRVGLAIEPLNRFENDLINTAAQAAELCRMVGAGNLGIALDTFHMNIEEDSWTGAIAACGQRLTSFQVSENTRGTPGSGHIDFGAVLHALWQEGYRGPVIVEAFDAGDAVLAGALSLWRQRAQPMDQLAADAAQHLSGLWPPS
jgi:D-psicose/D-tagatose/L-ribulose 3-epimerase